MNNKTDKLEYLEFEDNNA